jgi:predicted transcriptional regulator
VDADAKNSNRVGEARQLRELGMSDRAIARSLGVSGTTIAKAIRLEALR